MRLRLLRRRLTISAPKMAIRSALPWPLRWLLWSLMLGFSAAVAMWAFEFGKEIAGLERDAQQQLNRLRVEVEQLRSELASAQGVAHASESRATTERAAQEALQARMRQLETDNSSLRGDLVFFERLIPAAANEPLAVRGLQGEPLGESGFKWQVLLIQSRRNAPEFQGVLEIGVTGTLDGRPWGLDVAAQRPLVLRQYLRLEGLLDLPPQAVVQTLTAKVRQGDKIKTVQVFKL